jgi:hypothetical protein
VARRKVRVIGPCEIAGVARGGTVDLEDTVINVDALVAAGHVEVLADEPPKPVSKSTLRAPEGDA